MLARQTLRVLAGNSVCSRWVQTHNRSTSTARPDALDTDRHILRNPLYVDIPEVTLPEVIWANLDKWADKTAVVCSSTRRSYTYATLQKRSLNLAKALRGRLNLKPGTTIAILLPNVPEYPIALLGSIDAGLVVTTVNPIYTTEEICRQLTDSNTQAIITLGEYYERALEAMTKAKRRIPILAIKNTQGETTPKGAINFDEFCDNETNCDRYECGNTNDVIVMPYSSGTTGLPKGVELSHKNIIANICQITDMSKLISPTTASNQDVIPAVLPMFHIYGMTVNTLKVLTTGAKIVTVPKFTPDSYVEMLADFKPHHLVLVPPIVIFLAAHPSVTQKHLDGVQSLMSGAAPLGASDVERLFEKTGREIAAIQGYGMTETAPAICMTPPEIWKECLGSIGHVMCNTECKVVGIDDPSGTPLGPNEQGEFLVRGPQVMKKYHNNSKATEEVFLDGWLRTGDMVYYDDQKIIWITDRLKELIKVKGFQVAPAELEAIIRTHPQIDDAAVIGVPHPIYGEVPRAFIVAKQGAQVQTEQVQDFVAKQVASYKRLHGGVTVLQSIPKNASGKIMRRTLKAEHCQ